MTARSELTVLRTPAWPTLLRRLEVAIKVDPRLCELRSAMLRPAELLELLAKDTLAALGDDVLAAERLRAALHLAWPYASAVDELAGTFARAEAVDVVTAATPYEPGVLDFGALLIVGLGAIRVAPPHMARNFVRAVHGLALAAEFVEVIGRLDPAIPTTEALMILARTAYMLEPIFRDTYRPFLHDPIELARRRRLDELFGDEGPLALELRAPQLWHGAYSDAIESVSLDEDDPSIAVIRGAFQRYANVRDPRVVFAAPFAPPQAAELLDPSAVAAGGALHAKIPESASHGWIGISDAAAIARSNEHRASLKAQSGLRVCGAPVELIPMLGQPDPARPGERIAVPPRTGANRFDTGRRAAHSATGDAATVVLIRPALLGGPEALTFEDAAAAVRDAMKRCGFAEPAIEELPWVDDTLAVLSELPASSEADATAHLLAALSRRAMLTPGMEHALWLVFLPDDPRAETAIARELPAAAARSIAVADRRGLTAVIRSCFSADRTIGVVRTRLRVLGRLEQHGLVLDSTLEETRAAGPGGREPTRIDAVSYDRDDRELGRSPVTSTFELATFAIELLLPVSPDAARVELVHQRAGVLASIPRIAERPAKLEIAAWEPPMLTWRWSHPLNVQPRVSVRARSGNIVTEVFSIPPCWSTVELPLSRLGEVEELIVVACDGWNTISHGELKLDRASSAGAPVVLRSVADRRFLADVPAGWDVSWSLDDVELPRGTSRSLMLEPHARGSLTMIAREPRSGRVITERIQLTERGA